MDAPGPDPGSGAGLLDARASLAALRCDGRVATIVGTSGDDDLIGTPGDDGIVGLGGNDRIRARGGDFVICGGGGDDDLAGNSGERTQADHKPGLIQTLPRLMRAPPCLANAPRYHR